MKNQTMKMTPMVGGKTADFSMETPRPYIYMSPIDKSLDSMSKQMEQMVDTIGKLTEIVRNQSEHIHELYERVNRICPDYDLYQTMADDDLEFQMMLDVCMNRNETAAEEIDAYKEYINKELERVRELDGDAFYDEIREFAMDQFQRDRQKW